MSTLVYNSCFSIKKKNFKSPRHKTWTTKGFLKSIRKGTSFIDDFFAHRVLHGRGNITGFRNKLDRLMRLAKRSYYERKLDEYKSNVT